MAYDGCIARLGKGLIRTSTYRLGPRSAVLSRMVDNSLTSGRPALRSWCTILLAAAWGSLGQASPIAAQSIAPTGLEVGVLPAINFDSDEGFGYGAIAELYQYGAGDETPYVWTLQPTLFLTTEGRRDFTVFFDAPRFASGGWRLTAFGGREKQIATPWYGLGNATAFSEDLEADDGPNPFYYRFGLVRESLTFDLQRPMGDLPVRLLVGGGLERSTTNPVPDMEGTTLYAVEHGAEEEKAWLNYLRAGLVWDTRDRETGPTSGVWTELVVRRTDRRLAADVTFNRITFTDRRYWALTDRLVFAHRVLGQHVTSGAPDFELSRVQSSFKQQEGLGGAKTVRGIMRNRYVGRGMVVWNSELRWRVADFGLLNRRFHAVVSAFFDQGRVWEEGFDLGNVFEDLHRGYGGGLRVGMGENFVAALDGGTSSEAGLGVYIGLGYLY